MQYRYAVWLQMLKLNLVGNDGNTDCILAHHGSVQGVCALESSSLYYDVSESDSDN